MQGMRVLIFYSLFLIPPPPPHFRYIVVCLLLARRRVVVDLVDELTRHVEEYIKTLKPPDAHEWHIVLQEITSFLQADSIIVLPSSPSQPSSSSSSSSSSNAKEEPYYPPPRLDPTLRVLPAHTPYPAHTPQALAQAQAQGALTGPPPITLQQVVLVGNHASQVKFSELTLEMFRMMLALELDTDVKVISKGGGKEMKIGKRYNFYYLATGGSNTRKAA